MNAVLQKPRAKTSARGPSASDLRSAGSRYFALRTSLFDLRRRRCRYFALRTSPFDLPRSGDADAASDVENPDTFTARRWDAESALMQYRNRYYDPGLGRFVGRDPVLSLNFYQMVGGRPATAIDPYGLQYDDGTNIWDYRGRGEYIGPRSTGDPATSPDTPEQYSQETPEERKERRKRIERRGKKCCGDVLYDPNTHCCEDEVVVPKKVIWRAGKGFIDCCPTDIKKDTSKAEECQTKVLQQYKDVYDHLEWVRDTQLAAIDHSEDRCMDWCKREFGILTQIPCILACASAHDECVGVTYAIWSAAVVEARTMEQLEINACWRRYPCAGL